MRQSLLLIASLSLLCPIGLANDLRLVAESDPGVVFGDLDCQIEDAAVSPPRFVADNFDYLHATVSITHVCIDRSGRRHTLRGQDTVWFPTASFSWADQSWYVGDTLVAMRGRFGSVQLAEGIETNVWSDAQETHTAFKVELWEPGS